LNWQQRAASKKKMSIAKNCFRWQLIVIHYGARYNPERFSKHDALAI